MKFITRTRSWALMGAAMLAALGLAGTAQAGVSISVGIPLGGYVAAPVYAAPVYAAPAYVPAPVYSPPAVVYSQPAPVVYAAPAPVIYGPSVAPVYVGARFGWGWHHHGWR